MNIAMFNKEKSRIAIQLLCGEKPDFSKLREIYKKIVWQKDFLYNPEKDEDDKIFWEKCVSYSEYMLSQSK